MWWCPNCSTKTAFFIILPILFNFCNTTSLKDIFNLNTNKLVRVPREDKLYLDRYGGNVASQSVLNTRTIKPEDAADTRDPPGTNLGKRCIRCEGGRYPANDPYDSRRGYEDRGGYRDRYEDRYDDSRDRYPDRRYEPYDRYDRYDRYERYDQRRDYYDRDRYGGDRGRDRYGGDRDRDRYGGERDRDRYGGERDRYYDRGIGYDNRGYDYRDYRDRDTDRDRESYRPSYYDDRYADVAGRGYAGRPYDYGGGGGYSGSGGGYTGGGYASSWNYGGGRDERDRYGEDRYRYRDPYDAYRPTSYLYGRPAAAPISNTTIPPNNADATEASGSSSG